MVLHTLGSLKLALGPDCNHATKKKQCDVQAHALPPRPLANTNKLALTYSSCSKIHHHDDGNKDACPSVRQQEQAIVPNENGKGVLRHSILLVNHCMELVLFVVVVGEQDTPHLMRVHDVVEDVGAF
eukprot:1511862-Amphidinium_carterae.2